MACEEVCGEFRSNLRNRGPPGPAFDTGAGISSNPFIENDCFTGAADRPRTRVPPGGPKAAKNWGKLPFSD